MPEQQDVTEVSMCVGTFDRAGIPISITKQLDDCATVAFQSITLNLLISRCLNLESAKVSYVYCQDGSSLRIERNLKGFVGYLEATNSSHSKPHKSQ